MLKEKDRDKNLRAEEWQKILQKQSLSNVIESKLIPGMNIPTFIGNINPSLPFNCMRAHFEDRFRPNHCYLEVDGRARKGANRFCGMPEYHLPTQPSVADIRDLINNGQADVNIFDGDFTMVVNSANIQDRYLDINGCLTFKSDKIIIQGTYIRTCGELKFISKNENCYIQEIILMPGVSSMPMLVWIDIESLTIQK